LPSQSLQPQPGFYRAFGQVDLKPQIEHGVKKREYVHRIEQAIIDTLVEWNIVAIRREGAPGVYVGEAKIAALGIRVRKGRAFHGLAFNVAMDLEPFTRINPCGYVGLQVISLADLGGAASVERVKNVLLAELAAQFSLVLDLTPTPALAQIQSEL